MEKIKNNFTGIDSAEPIGAISGSINSFDAKFFATDLREITSRGVVPKIVINSAGGEVFAGMEIIDAMLGTNVNTHVSGMAFSMAGVIALFGKHRTMNDFAMMMIHSAKDKSGKNNELLEKVNTSMRALLVDRSNLTSAQITDIFDNNKDLFFNAQEALKAGLIDEVVSTKVEARFQQTVMFGAEQEFFNTCVAELDSNQITNIEMENEFKEVKAVLGLDSSDNERAILNAIKDKDAKAVTLRSEITAQNEEIEGLKGKIASMNDDKASELVNEAVKAGKVKEEAKTALLKMAKADYASAKEVIDNMVATTVVPESIIANMGTDTTASLEDEAGLLKMGYNELASSHPDKLKKIAEEQPELFDKLIDNANQKVK